MKDWRSIMYIKMKRNTDELLSLTVRTILRIPLD